MIISITEENIKDGIYRNNKYCPVALALLSHFGNVSVGTTSLNIENNRLFMDHRLGDKIIAFDTHKGMKPFKIKVDLDNKFVSLEEDDV